MTWKPTKCQRQKPVPAHGKMRIFIANRGFCIAWVKQCNRNCLRPRNKKSVVWTLTHLVLRTEYVPVWRYIRLCCGARIRITHCHAAIPRWTSRKTGTTQQQAAGMHANELIVQWSSEASLLAQPQEASALHSRPLNTIEDRESV